MLKTTCYVIWPNSAIFSSQHEVGRGGVVSLLSPHLISSIIDHGSNPMHMIVWIFLSFQNHSLRIVNFYAPNDVVEKSQLWHWMVDSLPLATWVVYEDFNKVKLAIDKEGILPFHLIVSE